MTIPNLITLFRIILIPVFIRISLSVEPDKYRILFAVLLSSGITDVLDGFIARKFDMKSKLGTLLDPVADKLMQISVFLCLAKDDLIPFWLVMLVFIKEFTMTIGAAILLKNKTVISADYSGKTATAIFYASSFIFMLFKPSLLIKNVIILIIVLSVLYAFWNYSMIFYKTIVKENDKNVQTYKH